MEELKEFLNGAGKHVVEVYFKGDVWHINKPQGEFETKSRDEILGLEKVVVVKEKKSK